MFEQLPVAPDTAIDHRPSTIDLLLDLKHVTIPGRWLLDQMVPGDGLVVDAETKISS